MANALAEGAAGGRGVFLSVKGPELLNKFVGESERLIRMIFKRARERAADGKPVIVFIDEMDSLLRTRGSGVSSDVETTIVPQFLAELDGVETLGNVMVIGASNRIDMIDPAVLRPGRLDVKIRVERPKAAQAAQTSAFVTASGRLDCEVLQQFALPGTGLAPARKRYRFWVDFTPEASMVQSRAKKAWLRIWVSVK